MKELILALGLIIFIEGMLYALFPSKIKNIIKTISKFNHKQLRSGGLIFAVIGFCLVLYLKYNV